MTGIVRGDADGRGIRDIKGVYMSLQFQVDYPESFPDALNESREQFESEAKMAMAVKLFEMNRLSSGMAASLLGISRVSFLFSLHRYGVAAINLQEKEFLDDICNA